MILEEILFQYQNLIFKIDSASRELEDLHFKHLVCKPGCSQCCEVERTVFYIEAYIVEQHLHNLSTQKINRLKKLYKNNDEVCPMLLRNRCVIYPARPIICRTHGLPILYREAERAFVDHCRLNFANLSSLKSFSKKEILNINPFNVELIQIDKIFSEHILGKQWRPENRKSLKSILFHYDFKTKKQA